VRLLGAVLAACDGLVWSELAPALPGTGGTYFYLREIFRKPDAKFESPGFSNHIERVCMGN
jgi:hypothetical protein